MSQFLNSYLLVGFVLAAILAGLGIAIGYWATAKPASPASTEPAKPSGLITVGETLNYRKGRKALRRQSTETGEMVVTGFRSYRRRLGMVHRILVEGRNAAGAKIIRPEWDVLAVN